MGDDHDLVLVLVENAAWVVGGEALAGKVVRGKDRQVLRNRAEQLDGRRTEPCCGERVVTVDGRIHGRRVRVRRVVPGVRRPTELLFRRGEQSALAEHVHQTEE